MRDITLRQWALAVFILLTPWVAEAAGLGRLTVLSSLGQPLQAEIDLVSVEKDELATLSARLASPDAYKQANLQYGSALVGLRLSIEKRPNGQLYIKITSNRSVNEPFIDLLVEINWASGRITREYTGLIDPPGFAPVPVPPAPVALPETRPAPAPEAPAVAIAPLAARPAVAAPVATGGKEYGPIKRGETLYKIASSMKPEGVTLEQMLAGLYRTNPDAFSRNMNRMKTGKILRVPEKEDLAAVPQSEAVKEVRVQAADWNAYRRKLADSAGMAPESRPAARGKITTKVEDRAAAGEVKEVVRLSKGEPPKGAAGAGVKSSAADRVRTLEEEAIARDKALSEANERIAQLEKNLKDMQQLLAIKSPGMAGAQQKAAGPTPEAAKPVPKPVPEAPKSEPKPDVAAAKPEPDKPAAETAVAGAKKEETAAAAPAPATEVKAEPPKPKPKPMPKPVPPPPEPDVMDMVMDNLPLVGGIVLLLGGLGFWMVRRRRSQAGEETGDEVQEVAPSLMASGAGMAVSDAFKTASATAAEPTMAGPTADEVDPLAEAEVYIAYGRDTQAEEILKEALGKNPAREDVQLKLLEIYAARKDKTAFNRSAETFSKLVGGDSESWLKVAAMGYALDPGRKMYAAGQSAAPDAAPPEPVPASDLDFDLGHSTGATSTDISFDPLVAGKAEMAHTSMMDPGEMRAMAGEADEKPDEEPMAPLMPDFTLEIPEAGATSQTDVSFDAHTPDGTGSNIDFNIELPRDDTASEQTFVDVTGAKRTGDSDAGLDFKIDMDGINLNLDDKPEAAPATEEGDKDAYWYDVQTKFDLAKAYQEMGDKDGATEILQEVIKEGDAGQQVEAKKLLETLG